MRAMLGPDHADRRQLRRPGGDRTAASRALLLGEPMPATTARLRVVIDDLIDLILRLELAPRTRMPGLPARLAPLTLPRAQLLRLRPRLRPPLRP